MKSIKRRKDYPLYRVIKFLVWLFYPKMTVDGAEHLPEEPALIVGNHAQMNGPIACELYFPRKRRTWCIGEMMHLREVPDYAFQDFWSRKPRSVHWFYRLLSYVIAPFSVCVFNNADTIAVYRDTRLIGTFRNSMKALADGEDVVIFPEHDAPYNQILCQFQDKFVDTARFYYKKTGKALCFVPLYLAPALHKMVLGEPVRFCPEAPIEEERQRICDYLAEEITQMAEALPRHRVVPYNNISRRDYPYNRAEEVNSD